MKEDVAGLCVGFIDCETTGIAEHDEPISIGVIAVKLDAKGFGEPFAEWHGEQCPSVSIHPAAQRVHGRSRESLAGRSFDIAGLRAVLGQVEVLVAHNAKFDARMIRKVVPDLTTEWEWRCSYRQWPWAEMQNKKLDTVCEHFDVERPEVHGALADVKALMAVAMQRMGKTERSRTYVHKLLMRGAYDVDLGQRSDPRQFQEAKDGAYAASGWKPMSQDDVKGERNYEWSKMRPEERAAIIRGGAIWLGILVLAIAIIIAVFL